MPQGTHDGSLLPLLAPTVATMTAGEIPSVDFSELERELDQARAVSAQAAERLRAFSSTRRDVNAVLAEAVARQSASRTLPARLRAALTRHTDSSDADVVAARQQLAELDARMEQAAAWAQQAHAHARGLEQAIKDARAASRARALSAAQSGPRGAELTALRDQERRAAASAALLRRVLTGVEQVVIQLDGATDALTQHSYRPLPSGPRGLHAALGGRTHVDVSGLNLGPLAGQTPSGSALPATMRDELVASLRSLRDHCRALSVSASEEAWLDARRQANAVRYEVASALAWLEGQARESAEQADAIVRTSMTLLAPPAVTPLRAEPPAVA